MMQYKKKLIVLVVSVLLVSDCAHNNMILTNERVKQESIRSLYAKINDIVGSCGLQILQDNLGLYLEYPDKFDTLHKIRFDIKGEIINTYAAILDKGIDEPSFDLSVYYLTKEDGDRFISYNKTSVSNIMKDKTFSIQDWHSQTNFKVETKSKLVYKIRTDISKIICYYPSYDFGNLLFCQSDDNRKVVCIDENGFSNVIYNSDKPIILSLLDGRNYENYPIMFCAFDGQTMRFLKANNKEMKVVFSTDTKRNIDLKKCFYTGKYVNSLFVYQNYISLFDGKQVLFFNASTGQLISNLDKTVTKQAMYGNFLHCTDGLYYIDNTKLLDEKIIDKKNSITIKKVIDYDCDILYRLAKQYEEYYISVPKPEPTLKIISINRQTNQIESIIAYGLEQPIVSTASIRYTNYFFTRDYKYKLLDKRR